MTGTAVIWARRTAQRLAPPGLSRRPGPLGQPRGGSGAAAAAAARAPEPAALASVSAAPGSGARSDSPSRPRPHCRHCPALSRRAGSPTPGAGPQPPARARAARRTADHVTRNRASMGPSQSNDNHPSPMVTVARLKMTCIWNPIHLYRIGQNRMYQYGLVHTSTYRYIPVQDFLKSTY
jgi:hypothetical protein